MNLPTEVFGDVVVAHAPDEVTRDQAEGMKQFLLGLERSNIVLDLDGSESLDSVGLETLLSLQTELRALNGDLKISTTNHVNRKILEITRLESRLEVFDSVIDAVRSYC
ncbi:MAG: STAS domain-containing protein [Pirellulales bacterium]